MTKRLEIRLPDDMHERLSALALEGDRSLNAEMVRGLRYWCSSLPQPSPEQRKGIRRAFNGPLESVVSPSPLRDNVLKATAARKKGPK